VRRVWLEHGLPFELGPLFGEVAGRFPQQRRHPGARLLIEELVGGRERFLLRLIHATENMDFKATENRYVYNSGIFCKQLLKKRGNC
jgi:hypothetical protein